MSRIPAIPERCLARAHELYAMSSAQGVVFDASGAWEHVLRRVPDAVITTIGRGPTRAPRSTETRFARGVVE